MKKASEDQRPMNWISDGGTPFSASDVAPPALMDWPAMSRSKKRRRREMKNWRVGMAPLEVSQRGEARGKRESREARYLVKNARGSILQY